MAWYASISIFFLLLVSIQKIITEIRRVQFLFVEKRKLITFLFSIVYNILKEFYKTVFIHCQAIVLENNFARKENIAVSQK